MLLMFAGALARGLGSVAAWTRRRPFWAGCLLVAAGIEILLVPVAGTWVIVHTGVGGYAGFLLGLFLVAMGLGLWFASEQRFVIAVLAILAALAAFVLSNLGGLLVGSLVAIVGASMGSAWTPRRPSPPQQPQKPRPRQPLRSRPPR
ncbi:hypothetical protein FH608_022460 [Nonomuraea phyllanthi]|uniref:Uncharacterized protein n=2 Tax=Nonomuraea phyllanthi TaxID=2219224 RepID=A0A5C4WC75_9ACTN|nr:hypothetical protein FH608_022460 [Nonomuraea phyllanthi]